MSKATACRLRAFSRNSPFLMSMPFWAPSPAPTRMAVGVAIPIAQGQATITTATKVVKATPKVSCAM